jgi:hypothetical protein
MAEALKLARAALDITTKSLDALPAEGRPGWVADAQALAAEAHRRTTGVPLPELERDARPTDEDTFRTIIDALLAVEDRAGTMLVSPAEIGRLRAQRLVATGAIAVLGVAFLVWMFHVPMFSKATSSAQFAEFGPDNAIDGDVKTCWILPGATGWLDLTLGKPRAVAALRVVSGNPPLNDRLVKDVHIEAFMNGAVVKALDFTFREPPGPDADWTTIPLGAPKSDRIRITVKSNYKLSPGLAEVQIE